jgi:hypothetical protein
MKNMLTRRIIAITVTLAMLIMIIPVSVTVTVEGATVGDPLDAAIAPHFSKVIYTTTAPAYSTSCDARGYFKALTGTPGISVSDSRVVLNATSSGPQSMVLSKTDVRAINKTTAHYEMSLNVSNTLAWANISLMDNSPRDWVNISIHSGAFYYGYASTTNVLGVLYSPAVAGTDYTLAFDLTTTSVTLQIYSDSGTLLADKYISTNHLIGGHLDEIRWELSGSSSSTLRLDYFYVMNATSGTPESEAAFSFGAMLPDDNLEESRVDLDPTALTLDESLREELFGFDGAPLGTQVTKEDLINSLGSIGIHEQRASGKLVADGYKNLKTSVDWQLRTYLADLGKVDIEDIHLVDYYVDYLQCKVTVKQDIVDGMRDTFNNIIGPLVDNAGGALVSPAQTSSLTAHVLGTAPDYDATDAGFYYVTPVYTVSEFCRGLGNWDPLGTKAAADRAEQFQNYLEQQLDDARNLSNAAWQNATTTWNNALAVMDDWRQSSEETFRQVNQNFLNLVSISNAQMNKLASDYNSALEKGERTFNKFYDYTTNQFEATNAIIAKLLMQNVDLSNSTQQMNAFFAGQLASTNEVVLNLTSSLANSLNPASFWSGVMDSGKPSSQPLTFSGFFGNSVQSWTMIFVIGIVSMIIVVVLVMVLRPRRSGTKRKS